MHSPAQCQPGQPQLLLCGHEWEEFSHQDLKGGVGPRLKGDLSQAASSGPPKEGLGSGEVPGHTWGHHAPAPSSSKSFQFSPVAPGPGHCWHVHRPRRSYYPGVGEECSSPRGTLTVPREDTEHELHLPCIGPPRFREHN